MIWILSALALLQPNDALTADELAYGWKTMSTQQLAAKLLPPRLAKSVVGHQGQPMMGADSALFAVTFFTKPRASLDGFCERRRYLVHANSESAMAEGTDVRLGACPAATQAEFAHVNPSAKVAEAKGALRWLVAARAAAGDSKPLPFDVDCVAEAAPDLCAGGARAALAGLPVEHTFIVDGSFTCRTGETKFAVRPGPGGGSNLVWDVRLVRADKQRPRLTLRGIVPPPF